MEGWLLILFVYLLYKGARSLYLFLADFFEKLLGESSKSSSVLEKDVEVTISNSKNESSSSLETPEGKKIELNPQQKYILSQLVEPVWKTNVSFITGAAGTGKSTLLKEFVKKISDRNYAIIAPTGIAALTVGGQTIHSFFGFPPRLIRYRNKKDIRKFYPRSNKRQVFKRLEYLIIDEISMVRVDLMDAIDWSLRINRDVNIPFGGVKVIMVGDPLQLEPVVKDDEEDYILRKWYSPFFFSARVWLDTPFRVFHLTQIMRQANDKRFAEILIELRKGKVNKLKLLNSLVFGKSNILGDDYLVLTPRRKEAEDINHSYLSKLPGEQRTYVGIIEGKFREIDLPVSRKIILKRGAKVLLMANDPDGKYVNGDRATVLELYKGKILVKLHRNGQNIYVYPFKWEQIEYVYDKEKDEIIPKIVGYFKQLPLRLAWAITIHKSQGLTLDSVYINLGKGSFAHGQTYVALSRCKSVDSLYFDRPIYEEDFIVKEEVKKFIDEIGEKECLWKLRESSIFAGNRLF